jgi:hypothetical protein
MEKGSLGYQMKVLNRLEQQGKISAAAKATWVAWIIAWKVTSIVGLNLDFTIPEQKWFFNIARKADTQFGALGNIAWKVKSQGAGTWIQIAWKVAEQIQILPWIQIAWKVTKWQFQVMIWAQAAWKVQNQGHAWWLQLAGTIYEEQSNILGLQFAKKNHWIEQWWLKMMDNRP